MVQNTIIQTELQTTGGQFEVAVASGGLLDLVRVSGNDTVSPADTTTNDRYAVGFLSRLSYPVVGRGLVMVQGILDGFGANPGIPLGLFPNKRYILSRTPGLIVAVDDTGNPNYPLPGQFLQFVGFGLTGTRLFVNISPVLLEVTP